MPTPCVVPNCNNVFRENRSVFRVPRNAVQYKQWVAAIPGIVTLKPTHVVCDKHFNEEDIIREWIKRDSNGRIIAQEPYKRPQLRKLAVPSKFHDLSTTKDTIRTRQWKISGESVGVVSDSVQLGSSIKESSTETSTSCSFVLPIVDGVELALPMDADPLVTTPVAHADTDPPVIAPVALVDTDPPVTAPIALVDTDPSVTAPIALKELITICSSVITRKYIKSESDRIYQEISNKLPEYWSVSKIPATNGQSILFTYAITRVENGKRLPVIQKCVTLDSDRKLQFYVYGRDVNVQKANLDEALEGIETLLNVLDKFKGMNVCHGLGEININNIAAGAVFQDTIQQWRSKDCSLIFKNRRCDSCTKMRKRIQQTTRRKIHLTLNHVSDASEHINRRKLIALRLKYRRQKCKIIRAKKREKYLTSYLKQQEEQIANMQQASLTEKCSALNISAAQQLALKEIIDAATKKGVRGRRYRDNWMMLYMLMKDATECSPREFKNEKKMLKKLVRIFLKVASGN